MNSTWQRLTLAFTLLAAILVHDVRGKDISSVPDLIGIWEVDSHFTRSLGTLGVKAMLWRKVGDSSLPDSSLVISNGSIQHRIQKKEGFGVITPPGMSSEVKEQDGTEYYVIDYKYNLDSKATPHQIDFFWRTPEGKQESSKGIYKIENGILWLAIGANLYTDKRPSEFEVSQDLEKCVIKATKKKE